MSSDTNMDAWISYVCTLSLITCRSLKNTVGLSLKNTFLHIYACRFFHTDTKKTVELYQYLHRSRDFGVYIPKDSIKSEVSPIDKFIFNLQVFILVCPRKLMGPRAHKPLEAGLIRPWIPTHIKRSNKELHSDGLF